MNKKTKNIKTKVMKYLAMIIRPARRRVFGCRGSSVRWSWAGSPAALGWVPERPRWTGWCTWISWSIESWTAFLLAAVSPTAGSAPVSFDSFRWFCFPKPSGCWGWNEPAARACSSRARTDGWVLWVSLATPVVSPGARRWRQWTRRFSAGSGRCSPASG